MRQFGKHQIEHFMVILMESHYYANIQGHVHRTSRSQHRQLVTNCSWTVRITHKRGTVKVKNNDPFEHPIIDPNSLSHPQDLADMIKIRVPSFT